MAPQRLDRTIRSTGSDGHRRQCVVDGEPILLDVYALHGQEEYSAVIEQFARTTECYALVYSATSRSTFDNMRSWNNRVRAADRGEYPSSLRFLPSYSRPAVLGALVETNFHDTPREVSVEEAVKLAEELGCQFYQTSTADPGNLDDIFDGMTRALRREEKRRVEEEEELLRPTAFPELKPSTKLRMQSRFHKRLRPAIGSFGPTIIKI